MRIVEKALNGVVVLEPQVFGDERGYFMETYNQRTFQELTGFPPAFVQDNQSRSARNVLRGLHYQIREPQGKLLRVISGSVFDVAVDLRRRSPTFGKWFGVELTAQNKYLAWIPPGFAHGFLTTSDHAEFIYKTTDFWAREHERTLAWDDPDLAIPWPLQGEPILSAKDRVGTPFAKADTFE